MASCFLLCSPRVLLALAVALPFATAHAQELDLPGSVGYSVHVVRPGELPASDENTRSLKLPAGLHIAKFAEGLDHPRVIVVSPAGNIYVSSRQAGTITMISADGASRKDILKLQNVHGLALHDGKLYYETVKEVYSAPLLPDGTLGASKLLIADLPDAGQHPNRTLGFGPDGKLYLTVGSTCNQCEERNLENATMLRANADGKGRETFATGLRNTIGFDFQPGTGALYGWDDGVDWEGDTSQVEELNKIEMGKAYGWPFIHGDGGKSSYLTPPKPDTLESWDAKSTRPVLTHTAHASGMQLIFLHGGSLPAEYTGDALATMHGSWNAMPPSGYEVVRIHFVGGQAKAIQPFVEGFLRQVKAAPGWARFARPFGLAQTADGSVLVGDEQNGVIYRITGQ